MYTSTKKFSNYSVAIRQWKAQHSHCQLLHGYSFEFKVWFQADELDEMGWVVDFGGFKHNGLKDWMNHMWDHTTLIQADDPYRDMFEMLQVSGLAKVHFLEKMGAESCARLVYEHFNDVLSKTDAGRCKCIKVECFENDNNSSIYEE